MILLVSEIMENLSKVVLKNTKTNKQTNEKTRDSFGSLVIRGNGRGLYASYYDVLCSATALNSVRSV